jgi:hypothetical protein
MLDPPKQKSSIVCVFRLRISSAVLDKTGIPYMCPKMGHLLTSLYIDTNPIRMLA